MKLTRFITLFFMSTIFCTPAHADQNFSNQDVKSWGIDAVMQILTFSHEEEVEEHMRYYIQIFYKAGI